MTIHHLPKIAERKCFQEGFEALGGDRAVVLNCDLCAAHRVITQPYGLLWRRAARNRAQISDHRHRILARHVVSVHGRAYRNSIRPHALLQYLFALRFGKRRKTRDVRRAHRPVRVGMNGRDPNRRALQPARMVRLSVLVARRMAFPAAGDFFHDVAAVLHLRRRGGRKPFGLVSGRRLRFFLGRLRRQRRSNEQNQCG